MNIKEFFRHHNIINNPFAEDESQNDTIFRDHCSKSFFHPAWDKVYGNPIDPSTAIIFGSKGSGKTAIRLQLEECSWNHNQLHPTKRVFVIKYYEFNGFLAQLQERLGENFPKEPEKILEQIEIQDHIDSILIQGVTDLVNQILQQTKNNNIKQLKLDSSTINSLDQNQRKDLLLLATIYDQAEEGEPCFRWKKLRQRLKVFNWGGWLDQFWDYLSLFIISIGFLFLLYIILISFVTFIYLIIVGYCYYSKRISFYKTLSTQLWNNCRVRRQNISDLSSLLREQSRSFWKSSVMPRSRQAVTRYELLDKFQNILKSLNYSGIFVLVDRIDEPELVNGKSEAMRLLLFPLLNNKLLRHPGIGFKLLLPEELEKLVYREFNNSEDRMRLDKQNVIFKFDWTGETLFDLMAERMKACSQPEQWPLPLDLFDPKINVEQLVSALAALRTPRNLFKFLYDLISEHCKKHTNNKPEYRISAETFEYVKGLNASRLIK